MSIARQLWRRRWTARPSTSGATLASDRHRRPSGDRRADPRRRGHPGGDRHRHPRRDRHRGRRRGPHRHEDDSLELHRLPSRPVHDPARGGGPPDGDEDRRGLALRIAVGSTSTRRSRPVRTTLLEVFAEHDSPSVQTSVWIMGRAILERHEEVDEVRMVLPNLHHWRVDLTPFGSRTTAGSTSRPPSRTASSRRPCVAARNERDAPHRPDRGLDHGPVVPGRDADPDPGGARVPRRPPAAVRAGPPRAAPAARGAPGRDRCRGHAGLPRRDPRRARVRVDRGAGAGRPGRPAGRDHRPGRAEDDDQRPELRGAVFMADLEDALSPTWANVVAGQAAIADATRGTLAFDSPEGKAYRLGEAGHARRPAARLAPHRVACARRRRPDLGVAVRRRDVPVPLGPRGDRGGERAVPVPREARIAPRGAPLERGLRPRPGGARHPARDDPGDRADRDDPRGVRDGRDPVRAARARRRPQRRPLGLPLQRASRSSGRTRGCRRRTARSSR